MMIIRDRKESYQNIRYRKEVVNMWTRKSVKEKGKKAFTLNFWKCVLVALILSIVVGSASGGFNGGSYIPAISNHFEESDVVDEAGDEIDVDVDDDNDSTNFYVDFDLDDDDSKVAAGAFFFIFLMCLFISIVVTIFGLAIKYFLLTPFEYGCRKFFRKNLDEPAKLRNLVYVFDSNYKNVVKTAFMTDLFIWLWSLLFIIPGIIKAYEYRMVPYIMSENPAMKFGDALKESKKLMTGNKWKTFVLDLSFIGWDILSVCTWGILEIFFVGPYKASTDAALYETLKYGIDAK